MTALTTSSADAFRHEALFYGGEAQFVDGTASFIRGGLAAGEPVLAVVSADGGSRRLRGIGEPIWDGRSRAELAECQRHEALLNVAFEGSGPWWLLCPYDTDALDPDVLEEAERTHPFVARRGTHRTSSVCRDLDTMAAPFDAPLPDPPVQPLELAFDEHDLPALRRVVFEQADRAGLDVRRAADLVLAVHELAVNSIRHGGGRGAVRVWPDGDALVYEVADAGHIVEPLVGRLQPTPDQLDGRGLWLVNQLCDLVQLRSYPTGTVVRIHASRHRHPTSPG